MIFVSNVTNMQRAMTVRNFGVFVCVSVCERAILGDSHTSPVCPQWEAEQPAQDKRAVHITMLISFPC